MTKFKDFFKHIGKKFNQNWRKILLWSVLLVFAVCGMVYSWSRKNKGEIVSGSADTSYTSFYGSNFLVYMNAYNEISGSSGFTPVMVTFSLVDTPQTFTANCTMVVPLVGFGNGSFRLLPDTYESFYVSIINQSLMQTQYNLRVDAYYTGDVSGNVIGVRFLKGTERNIVRYLYSTEGYVEFVFLLSNYGTIMSYMYFSDRTYWIENDVTYVSGYNEGFLDGVQDKQNAVNEAYTNGKNVGYNLAMETLNNNGAPTFLSLIDAVGYGVTKPFVSLLNFDLLGVNMLDFATSILTIFIVVKIITLFV